jgi:two-component system, LytTR family, sensor kinase
MGDSVIASDQSTATDRHSVSAWKHIAFISAGWALLTLLSSAQTYFARQTDNRPVPFIQAFTPPAANALLWIILTPAVLWFVRLHPIREQWVKPVLFHCMAAFLVATVQSAGRVALYPITSNSWSLSSIPENAFLSFVVSNTYLNFVAYWIVLGVGHVMRQVRLEREFAQARLDTLKMQLQPHFLFNTLHSISSLIHSNPAAADLMTVRLGDLLRVSLDQAPMQRVQFRKELEFTNQYIDILTLRFGSRLQVRQEVDPATINALVPSMLLQPLIENAVRHGLEVVSRHGLLEILTQKQNGRVLITVRDNGVGIPADWERRSAGLGLSNITKRLQYLYGANCRLSIQPLSTMGTEVQIDLPFELTRATPEGAASS